MAYFNGQNIFGAAVTMATVDRQRGAQENAYPGLNGMEELDQGLRGRITQVRGVLGGSDLPSLDLAEALFRSYNDGIAYFLVDTLGRAWYPVKYVEFTPEGRVRVMNAPGGGVLFFRPYTASFKHL